jgi:hypothetical protein
VSELTVEEELAAVVAAVVSLQAANQAGDSSPIPQDDPRWRFQQRWWLQGMLSLRQRPRPTP